MTSVKRRKVEGTKWDPELRFQKATKWGEPSSHRPDLGPCLIYLGADNGNGYGQFRYNNRNGYAHRYAWERANGLIPDGLTVDHLCRVRSCVNVDHFELVEGVENYRRGARTRTHCPNGHPYEADGRGAGKHRCRECARNSWQKLDAKRSAARRARGLRGVRHDQNAVRSAIADIRAARTTLSVAARQVGCTANYLSKRAWKESKADVIARDKCCALCGSTEALDAHHRIARGSGGSAKPAISFGMANLVALCRQHHEYVEAHPDWARLKGLRVDRGQTPTAVPVKLWDGLHILNDDGSRTLVEEAA